MSVTSDNDVAYLPHGTDLFPRLVAVVERIQGALESEIHQLNLQSDRFDGIPVGTRVASVREYLDSPNARTNVEELAKLSDSDYAQLEVLREEDRQLRAGDPLRQARQLTPRGHDCLP